MKIFVDESGNFTPAFGFSTVCALSLPGRTASAARREIEITSRTWPRVKGELKSASINSIQLTALVDILHRREGLLHCCAIDVSRESQEAIAAHKASQCEKLTEHLTPEHYPSLVKQVWELRGLLEAMPNQLYLQSVVMRELLCVAVEEVAMYFSQRLPREISRFEWIVDAKDPKKISTQEKWWRDTLASLVATRSERIPFSAVKEPEFDYRYFDRKFTITKEQRRPDKPVERVTGFDVRKLLVENLSFADSRSDILIQAVDILTGFVRRVLSDGITDEKLITQLGRLQIRRRRGESLQSMSLLSLSNNSYQYPGLPRKMRRMTNSARVMTAK